MTVGRLLINLYGEVSIRYTSGDLVELPYGQLAAVAVLAAAGRPVRRTDVEQTLSSSGLMPTFSRLKRTFGEPVHRVVGSRSGLIELNRDFVETDVSTVERQLAPDIVEIRETIRRLLLVTDTRPMTNIALSSTAPLTDEIAERFEAVRLDCRRHAAAIDLVSCGRPDWLLPPDRPRPYEPGEVWLAYFDRRARMVGRDRALAELDAISAQIGPTSNADAGFDSKDRALLVIDTAYLPPLLQVSEAPRLEDAQTVDDAASDVLSARLTYLHRDVADQSGIDTIVRDLTLAGTPSLGCWEVEGSTAVETLRDLVTPLVAHAARQPAQLTLQPLFARMFRALIANESLDNPSNYRFFVASTASLLREWASDREVVLIIGRRHRLSIDVDRRLTELLDQDERFSAVVVHREDPDVERIPSFPSTAPESTRPTRTDIPLRDLDRALAVSAICCSGDHLLPDLASFLLRRVGLGVSLNELCDSSTALTKDGAHVRVVGGELLRAAIDRRPDSDRLWLTEEAVRWLVEWGSTDTSAVTLLLDHASSIADRNVLFREAIALVRRAARFRSNQGSHNQAVGLLGRLLELPIDPIERTEVLVDRGDNNRILGDWPAAITDYKEAAAALASGDEQVERLTEVALRMAQLTWDPMVGVEVDKLLRLTSARLGPDQTVLRAQVRLCQAGGSFQDGTSVSGHEQSEIEQALLAADSDRLLDPEKRAWARIHGRKALLGTAPLPTSIELAERIIADAGDNVELLCHGSKALFVDAVRGALWPQAEMKLVEIERLGLTQLPPDQHFTAHAARVCWELAKGRIAEAEAGLAIERTYHRKLSGLTYHQVVAGHEVWIAREKEDFTALKRLTEVLLEVGGIESGGTIWPVAAAMLLSEMGEVHSAASVLRDAIDELGGLDRLPQGAHWLPTIAMAAQVALAAKDQEALSEQEVLFILDALETSGVSVVLVGWPVLMLGAVDRFRAMALAALGREETVQALWSAQMIEQGFPALLAQTKRARSAIAG